MLDFLGSAVGAGLNFFGASQANKASKSMSREQMRFQERMVHQQNVFSQASAQHQMDFQERMSNTQYQRAVEDLKAAGINPVMAMNMGGASSPTGSSASGGAPSGSTAHMQNELAGAVSSALDARRAFAEVKNMQATNDNLRAQNALLDAQKDKTKAEIDYVKYGKYGQMANAAKYAADEVSSTLDSFKSVSPVSRTRADNAASRASSARSLVQKAEAAKKVKLKNEREDSRTRHIKYHKYGVYH